MSLVDYTVEGAVALITLNRPPVNALNSELISDIDDAVGRAREKSIRAVVITGNRHFAAGADIKRFVDAFESGSEPQASGLRAVVRRLEQLAKPVVAAIAGFALGGGLELAMGADFRYMADDAKVGQPEILLGIIPGAGGTQRLQRLVGVQRTRELVLSGRQVGAEEALAIGIADKVVPSDELVEVAMTDAAQWADGPTAAYGIAKRAVIEGHGRPLDEGLEIEADAFSEVFGTADAVVGIKAFVAKEKPSFSGE